MRINEFSIINPNSFSQQKLETDPIFLETALQSFEIQLNSLEENIELAEKLVVKLETDGLTHEEKQELHILIGKIHGIQKRIGEIYKKLKAMLQRGCFKHVPEKEEKINTLIIKYENFLKRLKTLREKISYKLRKN